MIYIFFYIPLIFLEHECIYEAVNVIHDVITTANPIPSTAKLMFVGVRKNKTQRIRR